MKSLAKRRRDYIFTDPPKFAPVTKEQIRGAPSLLGAFDKLIYELRNFQKLRELGVELRAGALFHGPRGTGKTYFARYLASASNARFIDVRGFPRPIIQKRIDALVAEDMREIYRLSRQYVAKNNRPIILFYDEFACAEVEDDDIGDEDLDIFKQLRLEIQGLSGKPNGIFLVLATTRDICDFEGNGLFRAGRIDLHITFTEPTREGREDQLRFFVNRLPHEEDIDLKAINFLFSGDATPAMLEQAVQDAYRFACIQENSKLAKIKAKHLIDAAVQQAIGFVSDVSLNKEEQWITACHEAGHAIVGRLIGVPVQITTVLRMAKDQATGMTISIEPDDITTTKEMLLNRLTMKFGGYAAECFLGIAENTGPRGDCESATNVAKEFVSRLNGGSQLREEYGCFFADESRDKYTEKFRELFEEDVATLLKQAEKQAKNIIQKAGKAMVESIARALMDKKILLQSDLDKIMDIKA